MAPPALPDSASHRYSATPPKGRIPAMEIQNVNEAEIEAKVIEIVAEQMGVDKGEITRETSFTNDLNADSLDTVELVMEFEDEFDTTIPDDQAEKISTVGHAIDYIKEHMGS
jgi:acyl carrier protein